MTSPDDTADLADLADLADQRPSHRRPMTSARRTDDLDEGSTAMTLGSPRLAGSPRETAPAGRRFRQPRRPRPAGRPGHRGPGPVPPPIGSDAVGSDARLPIATALSVPVVALALAPPLPFEHGPWLSLCLAAPVAVWGAAPFHRAAGDDLRHTRLSSDAAVSLAVTAGFVWSVLALFVGDAATVPPDLWSVGSTSHLHLAPVALLTCLALAARDLTPTARPTASSPDSWAGRPGVAEWVGGGVVVGAAATWGFWLAASGDAAGAAAAGVAVLVLACPGGLLLATPTVLTLARRRSADLGVGIDSPEAATAARRADTIVVRRSGTLTTGRPWLVDVVTAEGVTVEQTLHLVGSLARRTRHPVGRAVVEAARERCLPLAPVEVLASRPGLGVRGVVDGRIVVAGRERFVAGWARRLPEHLATARTGAEAAGQIALLAGWDDAVRAVLIFGDPPRPAAADAVATLAGLGVRTVLVSGDSQLAAMAVADVVGVAEVVPAVLSDETAGVIAQLRDKGRTVVTLDGRFPADLAIGLGPARDDGAGNRRTGSHYRTGALQQTRPSFATADDPLQAGPFDGEGRTRADLWSAVDAIRLGRAVDRVVRQNLLVALAVEAALLPLAAAGRLAPAVVVAATALSTLAVAANSCRIRRFRSVRPPAHRCHPA